MTRKRREDTEMTHEKTQGYTAQTFLPSKTPPPTATQDRALSSLFRDLLEVGGGALTRPQV